MTYTKHPEELKRERVYSSCALLEDENGAPLVAVAGGDSKGMEIWNPKDGTVTTQIEVLPPEGGSSVGLQDAQLVSINEGRELLLYGGRADSVSNGIWKFSLAENTWSKVGTMLIPREELIVLPVKGIHC